VYPNAKLRPAGTVRTQNMTNRDHGEGGMPMALTDLLTTDYGLLSLAVIVGVIVIGVYMTRMLNRLMNEPGDNS
jgi:hypothetical protein